MTANEYAAMIEAARAEAAAEARDQTWTAAERLIDGCARGTMGKKASAPGSLLEVFADARDDLDAAIEGLTRDGFSRAHRRCSPPNERPCAEPGRVITITVTVEGHQVDTFGQVGGSWLDALDKAVENLRCRRGEILDRIGRSR